ncbi:MAG: hypothetical protein LW731_07570 [Oxalobacteraceae bacterium]|nr:hypothetical protein [Oxalobacteraceae bacterium]
MKKMLMLFAITVMLPASAEWVKIAEAKRGNIFYVDPSTVSIADSRRVVLELIDYRRPDRDGDKSVRINREYDCQGARYQVQSATYHRGSMGTGDVSMSTVGTMGWTDIDPNTPARAILDYVCAVK